MRTEGTVNPLRDCEVLSKEAGYRPAERIVTSTV
jgi:hypothetical protein